MRMTEYFRSAISNINMQHNAEPAIAESVRKRDEFISNNFSKIEEIVDEQIHISWFGANQAFCCCVISISYFPKP